MSGDDDWGESLEASQVINYTSNTNQSVKNRGSMTGRRDGRSSGDDGYQRHFSQSQSRGNWGQKSRPMYNAHSSQNFRSNSHSNNYEEKQSSGPRYNNHPRQNFRGTSNYRYNGDRQNSGSRYGNCSQQNFWSGSSSNYSRKEPASASCDSQGQEESSGLIDWSALLHAAEEEEVKMFSHLPQISKVTYIECEEVKNMSEKAVADFRQTKNQISVSSLNDTPVSILNPVSKFEHALHPYPELLEVILAKGFKEPSPIQCQLWPLLMSGSDVVGIAQTGTGKTLAYLLPGLLHIEAQPYFRDPQRKGPLCLVLAPTRELAQQIQEEAVKFRYKGMKSVCVYGQGNYGDQCRALRSGVEIVVATPGRLIDFVNKDIVDVTGVSYLVLDEADRMLDMGFQPDILKITSHIRKDRQTVLTSATWPPDVEYIAKRLMKDPLKVRVGQLDLAAVATVSQTVQVCEQDDKIGLLLELLLNLASNDKVIVFCNKKVMVDFLAVNLLDEDIDARVMHGGVDQCDRESALSDLKTGACQVLLATDVASRGLDVTDLTLVINFDLPKNLEEYVHRSGRTGRAGRSGRVISFVTWDNKNQSQELIDILQRSNQEVSADLLKLAERAKRFRDSRPPPTRGRRGSSRW